MDASFPGNSKSAKSKGPKEERPPKNIEKVVVGGAIKKPKSLGERAKGLFLGSEIKTAGSYVFTDVLVPALRNLVVDSATKGIERVVYGDNARPGRSHIGQGGQSRISYSTPLQRGAYSTPISNRPLSRTDLGRRRNAIDDIIIKNRPEAEMVMERLGETIEQYGSASLADMYEMVGLPSSYTDNDWGWVSLANAHVRPCRDGYLLDLPPVEPIK